MCGVIQSERTSSAFVIAKPEKEPKSAILPEGIGASSRMYASCVHLSTPYMRRVASCVVLRPGSGGDRDGTKISAVVQFATADSGGVVDEAMTRTKV